MPERDYLEVGLTSLPDNSVHTYNTNKPITLSPRPKFFFKGRILLIKKELFLFKYEHSEKKKAAQIVC